MPHQRSRLIGWRIVGPALVAGLGAVGLYAWLDDATQPEAVTASQSFPWSRTPGTPAASGGTTAAGVGLPATDPLAMDATGAGDPSAQGGRAKPFRVDARGQLVVDQNLRLELESLLALQQGQALVTALDTQLAGLPAAAAARARELLGQYQAYQDAQRQSFPPGQAPLMAEEGLAQLKAMQALRATYLGEENAHLMFAQDDAVAQRILELMREDTATHLTMAEKAVRAQARYDMERNRVRP